MVSFDVPFARIDAKGLGNGGRDLGVEKIGAARRPTERLYAHVADAASLPSSLRRPGTKLRPIAPVSPVELVESNLTVPGVVPSKTPRFSLPESVYMA